MKIFKFGGASTKDAAGVKNILSIIKQSGEQNLVIVVSAMGKMTNALEKVVAEYFSADEGQSAFEMVQNFHKELLVELFQSHQHPVFDEVENLWDELNRFLQDNPSENHAFVYDQIVSFGELVSSKIISVFFEENGIKNTWLDVRECIKTDDNYREAGVNWELTETIIKENVSHTGISITQGFLGSESVNNFTTTLGREGSDYTAAIFGYCLDAESVTIWKDVPGVLNADPRYFSHTQLLNKISYKEAIELAFYGASVIHPKTLQPLQRKNIPLYVKSFAEPEKPGTCVAGIVAIDPKISCFILKKNLVLISLSSLDFSFIMEDHISHVFKWLHEYKMKVELIQNSAISFSVCISDKYGNLQELLEQLRTKFRVKWNEDVTLYTVRHFSPEEIFALRANKKVLMKQETQETVQLVIKE